MILLFAVLLGLIAGGLRARMLKRAYQPVELRYVWVVFLAFFPQLFSFYLPSTRVLIPNSLASIGLVFSQALLLGFALMNRDKTGFFALGVGLFLNFCAIILNGGWMPLRPETAQLLIPPGVDVSLILGQRIGFGKDILLTAEMTRLWFLGDIFILPAWMNYRLAFSFGDILICFGAFRFFWSLGNSQHPIHSAKVVQPHPEEKGCFQP